MIVIHVHSHVKPEFVVEFREATLRNARASLEEPGVIRFDVLQQEADPTRFLLVEIYRTAQDPTRHKEPPHYLDWRDTVAPMMAEPRHSVRYQAVFPAEDRWELPK
ncbi:MAG TPA: antibiotic biosynthesis monooxygenase [Acidobacteriota bacterium]|nr:antibiotic biosynthesis monooxygenase [Acidobacteriota bacterium]